MSQQVRGAVAQRVHILTRGRVHLVGLGELCALRLSLTGRVHVGDAHQPEELLRLLVVLAGHLDEAALLLHALCLVGGLRELLLGLLAPGGPLTQLVGLEHGRLAVEDVAGLDAVVDHAQRAVEHAHEVRGGLAVVVGQLSAVLLAHSDQELVQRHGRVDGHLAAEEGLDVASADRQGRIFGDDTGQTFDTHGRCDEMNVGVCLLGISAYISQYFP